MGGLTIDVCEDDERPFKLGVYDNSGEGIRWQTTYKDMKKIQELINESIRMYEEMTRLHQGYH